MASSRWVGSLAAVVVLAAGATTGVLVSGVLPNVSTLTGPSPGARTTPSAGPASTTAAAPGGASAPAGADRTLTGTVRPPESVTSGPAVTAAVRAARTSVVRVTGDAAACSQVQEGSGVVVAPGRVLTNAHVVQGLHSVQVQVGGTGRLWTARVVAADPAIDLAELYVPGLTAAPLTLATGTLPPTSLAVAAGFPLDGPFTLTSGTIRGEGEDAGPQVGSTTPQSRPVYALSVTVRPGNSGGPLLAPDGHVIGIVFARSAPAASAQGSRARGSGAQGVTTGFAITSAEALRFLAAEGTPTTPVSTGRCTPG